MASIAGLYDNLQTVGAVGLAGNSNSLALETGGNLATVATAVAGTLNVGGNVASGAADSGNPVKSGGIYKTTPLTLSDGQRSDFLTDSRQNLRVTLFANGSVNSPTMASPVDAQSTAFNLAVFNQGQLFNGSNWDRQRNNIDTAALITLTTSASGTFNSADQTNYNGRGLQLGVNITATTAQTLQVTVQGKDTVSGQYYTVGGGTAALASTGFTNVTIYPGITTTANLDFAQVLPRTWRVQAVVSGAGSTLSATVGASVIL